MTLKLETDSEWDQHLRRTLHAVAASISDTQGSGSAPRRSLRGVAAGIGIVTIAAPLAAATLFGQGTEYVDKLPPDNIIATGETDGTRYWMTESTRTTSCGEPVTGVELIVESHNLAGHEWNTMGVGYGQYGRCGYRPTSTIDNPALYYAGGVLVGDTKVVVIAVHPDITAVQVSTDGSTKQVKVYSVDGFGFAVFETSDTADYRLKLLIDDDVVPGSRQVPGP